METNRKQISTFDHKYTNLKDILLYLSSLQKTFKYVNTSHTANENLASLILKLCEDHIDLSRLKEDDICQLIFEFNNIPEHNLQLIRLKFFQFFLSQRKNISLSFAREVYDLSHSSGYKTEIIDLLLEKINWDTVDSKELQKFCEEIDEHQVWSWLVKNFQKDFPKEKISKEVIYEMAKKAKTFSKGILIDLVTMGPCV